MLTLKQLLAELDYLFDRKNIKELIEFFLTKVIDENTSVYQEVLKYNPYQLIKQIHLERPNEQYISFTFIYIPSQDYSLHAYKHIIDILEGLPPFVFEVSFNKKDFNEQHLISMIVFSNFLHMNMYTSMSDYKSVKRNSTNLYGSRMINIDLDVYNTKYEDYEDDEFYNAMMPCFNQIGMEPSIYMSSGHGKYISFILENNINFKAKGMKDLYQNVCKKIIELLAPFGADAKCSDPTHVFRVPGSINLKTNEEAFIISFDENKTISIGELATNLGIENTKVENKTSKAKTSSNKKKSTPKRKFTIPKNVAKSKYTRVNIQRDEDLQRLLELRNYDIVGFRNIFFHILAVNCFYMGLPEDEVLAYLHSLNNELINPYDAIESVVNYAKKNYDTYLIDENKAIKYTNLDIVEMLSITKEEQKEMQQLIDREEFKQRRCDSSIPGHEEFKKQSKQKTIEKRDALKEELLTYRLKHLATNKEIANHFNMDERKVCKLIGKEPKYITIGIMNREKLIFYYANLNYSNTQISNLLNVSLTTIKNIKRKYRKLGYTFNN